MLEMLDGPVADSLTANGGRVLNFFRFQGRASGRLRKRDVNLRRDRFAKLPAENNRFGDREKKLRITVPVIMFDIRLSSVLAAILTSDLCIYPWFLPIMSDVPRYGK